MSSQISAEKLSLLIGTANTPLIDARVDEDFSADSRLIPSAIRRSHCDIQEWREGLTGKSKVVICQKGQRTQGRHGGLASSRQHRSRNPRRRSCRLERGAARDRSRRRDSKAGPSGALVSPRHRRPCLPGHKRSLRPGLGYATTWTK